MVYRTGVRVRGAQSWLKEEEERFYRGFLLIFERTACRFFCLVSALIAALKIFTALKMFCNVLNGAKILWPCRPGFGQQLSIAHLVPRQYGPWPS